jgi:hypothetical protein
VSRQSKNARNIAKRKQITAMHKNGEKGPARTAPQHGKKWTYRSNPDAMKRLAEFLKGPEQQDAADKKEKTSGKRILRGAGKAAQPAAEA